MSFRYFSFILLTQVILIYSQKCSRNDKRQLYPKCMVDSKAMVLWCDQSNYTRVPDASKMHATTAEVTATTSLFINDSCITMIFNGDLSSFPNLRVLIAEKNMIRRLYSGAFSGNKKLKVMDLRNNFIEKVDSGAFQGLDYLTKLLMDNNRLSELTTSWTKELGALEELSLNYNNIAVLERKALKKLKRLKILRIQGNIINFIDEYSFSDLEFLTHLYLDGNRLSSITGNTFEGLQNLQVFTISHNRIESWPTSYGVTLPNLHTLHLGSNIIRVFTHEHVRNQSKLQNLSLENNSLFVIPEDLLISLESLRYLDLSNNYLKDIPKQAFVSSCYLTVLIISGNQLSTPHAEWFQHFTSNENSDAEVKMDNNPWDCSCDIIPFQGFLAKLEEDRKHTSFAEKVKITCASPKYARNKILDSDLIAEIEYRSSSKCPRAPTATHVSPTPCTDPQCDYTQPFTAEAFVESEIYSGKHDASAYVPAKFSDSSTASSFFSESAKNGTSNAFQTIVVSLVIMGVVLAVIVIHFYRKSVRKKRRRRTTSTSALLPSHEYRIPSPSELTEPIAASELEEDGEDEVFSRAKPDKEDMAQNFNNFDYNVGRKTDGLLFREEGDGRSRDSTPQVRRTIPLTGQQVQSIVG